MKYQYNGATNNLDEIPDLEDKLEKSIEDKEARDAGWKDNAELTAYLTQDRSASKGYWDKFVKQTEKEDKIDRNIEEFGKNFQPHKQKQKPNGNKNTLFGGNDDEWIMHNIALHDGKNPENLIEDVQLQENGEMRGMLTDKIYNAKEAIKMNEKYDRNFTNPNLRDQKSNYLTANEKILAGYNPQEALKYTNGGKDQENVKYMRYVKAKAKRIENLAKLNDKKTNPKKYKKENEKLFESILDNLKTKPVNKTALLTEDQKKDPKIIEVPFGPSFKEEIEKYEKEKEKEKGNESYRIKLPRNLEAMQIESDLERMFDRNSGIGMYDTRRRFAAGGNGSTSDYDDKHTFQKRIEETYGIQLTGQETIAELLEMVRSLNEKK
jgi:hypothetical protein